MELKKNNKVNLDKQRAIYFEIGLLIALGVVFAAFEWSTPYNSNIDDIIFTDPSTFETETAPIYKQEPVLNKPPQIISDQLIISDLDIPETFDPVFFEPGDILPNLGQLYANRATEEDIDNTIAKEYEVDIQAQFMNGGTDQFLKWVKDQIIYPEIASNNGIEGKVIASFVIDRKGNLTDIKILREIDPSLAEEIIRVLELSPKWKPAIRRGKVISVQYQMPFDYRLH